MPELAPCAHCSVKFPAVPVVERFPCHMNPVSPIPPPTVTAVVGSELLRVVIAVFWPLVAPWSMQNRTEVTDDPAGPVSTIFRSPVDEPVYSQSRFHTYSAFDATARVRCGSSVTVVVVLRDVSDVFTAIDGTNHVFTSDAVSTSPTVQVGIAITLLGVRTALVALAAAAALAACAAPAPSRAVAARVPACPGLVAHRGDAWPYSSAPENSLRAATFAYQAGAPAVETDVRFTRDGVPVIMHDATVNRTTRATGPVSSYRAAVITRLRLLEKPGARSSVTWQRVPSFTRYLARAAADHGRVLAEIKPPAITAAQAATLARVIRASGAAVIVHSFWPADLAAIRKALPGVRTQLLTAAYTAATAGGSLEDISVANLTAGNVAALHAAGIKAGAWTPDSRAGWAQVAGWGVDQVTTNNPAGYLRWCAAR